MRGRKKTIRSCACGTPAKAGHRCKNCKSALCANCRRAGLGNCHLHRTAASILKRVRGDSFQGFHINSPKPIFPEYQAKKEGVCEDCRRRPSAKTDGICGKKLCQDCLKKGGCRECRELAFA